MAYFMDEMSVRDLRRAMEHTHTVIIPVGVVEQHGYHLPLSTDYHNANEVPRRAGGRLNAVVAPTIPYCYSGGELLGTVNVSPQVFSLYVMDICAEFARMGFKNIVLFLGHAGTDNKNALRSCLQMLQKRDAALRALTFSLVEAWGLSPTWLSYFAMQPEHDFHAGAAETSLMLYWKPELVQEDMVMDDAETARMMRSDQDWFETATKPLDHDFIIPSVAQRPQIEVGVMGFPELASRELGEKICAEMVDGLVAYVDLLEAHAAGT